MPTPQENESYRDYSVRKRYTFQGSHDLMRQLIDEAHDNKKKLHKYIVWKLSQKL